MTRGRRSAASRPQAPIEAQSLVDTLRWQARRAPDDDAFIWLENGEREGGRVTFAGLDRRARAIARLVLDRDMGGKSILLAYTSGLDLVAALFGCFYAGAIAVVLPLAGSQSLDRARSVASDASAECLLTIATLVDKIRRELPEGIQVLVTDGLDEAEDAWLPQSPDPRSLALLQYTSGSTTTPRAVMLSHANLLSNLQAMMPAAGIAEGETAVNWLPFHHDMGLLGFAFFPIYARLRCVLMPPVAFLKRPARWLEAIDRYGAALSAGPCFAYDLCERRTTLQQRAALDLSRWRVAVCGGEVNRPEVLERFADSFAAAGFRRDALTPAYGLAEATVLAASDGAGRGPVVRTVDGPSLAKGRAVPPTSPERGRRLVSCGHPSPGHELIVVNPVRPTAMAEGEVGEIWLRGPSVSPGYWRRPLETAQTFNAMLVDDRDSRRWLRTGDLGFMSADGLMVTGRRKDMIIVRGANFDPLDLELAAESGHPALSAGGGGAFSFADAAGEHVVLAYEVERAAWRALDADAVVKGVAEAIGLKFGLALYDLILLRSGALPRTTSGKVQRHLCRERYLEGRLPSLFELRHPALIRWRSRRS